MRPIGKKQAPKVRSSPAALVASHGDDKVERDMAQPKPRRGPPMKELTNILSSLMRAFFAPIREHSSVVCAGVKASMAKVDEG